MVQLNSSAPIAAIANENLVDPVLSNDWHVVAKADELAPETCRSARLLGMDLVLWRGQDQQIFAWGDRCPHRSVKLSNGAVIGNTLVCPYHGMVYDGTGRCIKVPAHPHYVPPKQACVRTFQVQQRYGLVFVCLGVPAHDIPLFPEWQAPGYLNFLSGPHFCQTGGYRAIENFLDVAHFPFIHSGILGDPALAAVDDYQVSTDDRGVHLHNIRFWQPDPIGMGQGAYALYTYSALRPLTAYLRKDTPTGECLTILYCVTPVSEEECIGWMWVGANFIDDSQIAAALAFQDAVFAQDLGNLESHNPKRLPLNLQTEFHVPCDRGSLAYRQWLKQLGITYGVIL